MANVAECAIAIARDDLHLLNGAFKRDERSGRQLDGYGMQVKKRTYENDATGEIIYWYEKINGADWKVGLKKNGKLIKEFVADSTTIASMEGWLDEQGYHLTDTTFTKDEYNCDGWVVDFAKLNHLYSYDYEPFVKDRDDFIVLYFGAKWNFPVDFEDWLYGTGVKWQGAFCEDGEDALDDEIGNTDYGLRIGTDVEYYDGEEYKQYCIEITDERRTI